MVVLAHYQFSNLVTWVDMMSLVEQGNASKGEVPFKILIYIFVYLCTYCVYAYVYIHVCVYVCMYVCTYICKCVCVCHSMHADEWTLLGEVIRLLNCVVLNSECTELCYVTYLLETITPFSLDTIQSFL